MVFPNVLTDGVPKVPKGCSEGFCHFWHCLSLIQGPHFTLGVWECEAGLCGGSACLMPRESVPNLLSYPAVLHAKKGIFMQASKMLCKPTRRA